MLEVEVGCVFGTRAGGEQLRQVAGSEGLSR